MISLCMIVGNCADTLERTIESAGPVADEICIVVTRDDDGTFELAKKLGDAVVLRTDLIDEEFDVLRSFAEARNLANDLATHEYILWLDSDDELKDPHALRKLVEENQNADFFRMTYDYQHNAQGECTTRQQRDRILRRGTFEWASPIHEVNKATQKVNVLNVDREVSYVKHDLVEGDSKEKARRNLKVILAHEKTSELDARLKMYKAHALLDLGDYDPALSLYFEYLDESQWDKERYHVMDRVFRIYKESGNTHHAKRWCFEMMDTFPETRLAYLNLAEIYHAEGEWAKCIYWIQKMFEIENDDDYLLHNPAGMKILPLQLLQNCFVRLGKFNDALAVVGELMNITPSEDLEKKANALRESAMDVELVNSVKQIAQALPPKDRPKFFSAVPDRIKDYHEFACHLPKHRPEGMPVVAIYCGFDETRSWGPEDIFKGIGGSEEAVINMAREFSERGWIVEVYANVTKETEDDSFDNVRWYQAGRSNPADTVDLTICWRDPQLVKYAPQGRQTWLWLHDLQDKLEPYYKDVMDSYDKVMFLSTFHRQTAPWVPEDKVFFTTNGIDQSLVAPHANEGNRVIYASSPDRGLKTVLEQWPEVIKACPDAKLDVFYGYNAWYLKRYKDDAKMLGEMSWCLEYMNKEESITYHGSVGQDELAQHISKAGIWYYPTEFGEISCITAMKMQAGGAVPVCSRYAALSETVCHGTQHGSPDSPELAEQGLLDSLIHMLSSPEHQSEIRSRMLSDCKDKYNWSKVADQWIKEYDDANDIQGNVHAGSSVCSG